MIPTKEECLAILEKNKTPSNVIEHCKTVCQVAEDVTEKLIKKGVKVNKELVTAAALLHDVEREKEDHVAAGANLLNSLGFPEVCEVIKKHTLYQLEDIQLKSVEEKIVFYADKRVKGDKIVSLEKRFEDLAKRYNKSFKEEFGFAKKIGEELLK